MRLQQSYVFVASVVVCVPSVTVLLSSRLNTKREVYAEVLRYVFV